MKIKNESFFNKLYDPYKISKCDFLLNCLKILSHKFKINYTLLAICPNSEAVIRAAVKSAKYYDVPLIFAATLNQIDMDGGYTKLNFTDFVGKVNFEIDKEGYRGVLIIGIDHGGPWLKDKQVIEKWDLESSIDWVKRSFEQAILNEYDLIHIDTTIDKEQPFESIIAIELVVERTIELISHIEKFRKDRGLQKISYEVGTEEVHGGLTDIKTFRRFLYLLKKDLKKDHLEKIWPCFMVGQVGTDLHTTYFNPDIAKKLVKEAAKYNSYIKGHYTDYVKNPSEYPKSGIGGANIGPELTEVEFNTLTKLYRTENELVKQGKISTGSNIEKVLEKAVQDSGRWKKWLNNEEKGLKFHELTSNRRNWLVKTGARYIWTNCKVLNAREELRRNLMKNNLDSEEIIEKKISERLSKYFKTFNIIGLNSKLAKEFGKSFNDSL